MLRVARPSSILPITGWVSHSHERGERSLQEEWCHQGHTTPVKQLGLGKERTIKPINVHHFSSSSSVRWWEIQTHAHCIRTCCKREQDRDLCSILNSLSGISPDGPWNRGWCQESVLHILVTGHCCLFDLEFISQPALAGETGQWEHLMGNIWGMAAWVRQGQNTQTAASHPNHPLYCNTLLLSQTRSGFDSQWAVACFSLTN